MTVYVNTIGFELNLTVVDDDDESVIDIDPGNGTFTLDVRRPDGTTTTWTPTIINGPAGTAQYKTVDGDLDLVGTYTIQGHWDPVSAGEDFWSSKLRITVRDRVEACP